MKTKITLIVLLTFTYILKAQNPQVFDTFTAFETAVESNCSGTVLNFENFDGIIQSLCEVPVIPDPNQQCFAQNELENGFTIQGLSQTDMVAFEVGEFAGNSINIVGPNFNADTVLIDFNPGVNAVSFSTWQIMSGPSVFQVKVYGEANEVLGIFVRDSSLQGLYSFHVISDQTITRVETKSLAPPPSSAGLFIGSLYFGASNCVTPILVPDMNFEQLLVDLGFDDIIDGSVNADNVNTVTSLDVSSLNISNLKGIEAFDALEDFTCVNNPLTNIDLSNNTNLNSVVVNDNSELISLILELGSTRSTLNQSSLRNSSSIINSLDATNNPNLECIQVNNVDDAQNNPNWFKDENTVYSTDCMNTLSTDSFDDISNLITIYPNPVKDYFNIDYGSSIYAVEIYDVMGRKIESKLQSNNSVFLNNVNSGAYFVKIITDLGTITKKIIKK